MKEDRHKQNHQRQGQDASSLTVGKLNSGSELSSLRKQLFLLTYKQLYNHEKFPQRYILISQIQEKHKTWRNVLQFVYILVY